MARTPSKKPEEVIQEYDKKIAFHQDCIAKLEAKKQAALNPPKSKNAQLKALLQKAQESGLSIEELAEKLGVTL